MKTPFTPLIFAVLFTSAAAFAQDLTEAAKRLQKAYRAKVDSAVKPLRESYLREIQKLQADSTRAGKLDEALALKKEVERIQAEPFFGRWDGMHDPIVINSDRTIQHGQNFGKWEIQGDDLVLNWDNGWKHRHELAQPGDTIRGRRFSPEGKTNSFSLTRIQ